MAIIEELERTLIRKRQSADSFYIQLCSCVDSIYVQERTSEMKAFVIAPHSQRTAFNDYFSPLKLSCRLLTYNGNDRIDPWEYHGTAVSPIRKYVDSAADERWLDQKSKISEEYDNFVYMNALRGIFRSSFRLSVTDKKGGITFPLEVSAQGCTAWLTDRRSTDAVRHTGANGRRLSLCFASANQAEIDYSGIVDLIRNAQTAYCSKNRYNIRGLAYCTIKREYFDRVVSRRLTTDPESNLISSNDKAFNKLVFYRSSEMMIREQIRSRSITSRILRMIKKPHGSDQSLRLIKNLMNKLNSLGELIMGMTFTEQKKLLHMQRADRLLYDTENNSINIAELKKMKTDLAARYDNELRKSSEDIDRSSVELVGILKEISGGDPDEPLLCLELSQA